MSPELQAPRQISPELPVVVSPRKTHVTTVKSGTRVAHADPQPAAQMPRNPTPIPWETAYTLYHSLDQFRAPAGTDKPPFPYWVILRAAILGSPDKQLSLTDLTSQIMEKFPYGVASCLRSCCCVNVCLILVYHPDTSSNYPHLPINSASKALWPIDSVSSAKGPYGRSMKLSTLPKARLPGAK